MFEAIKNFLQPKQHIFYDLLIEQSAYVVEATSMVLNYLDNPGKKQKKQTRQVEKDADNSRRLLVAELNRTFVTPFDREDINALSRDLDDVVDYAYTTTEELLLFEMETNENLLKMANLLHDGAIDLHQAITHLQKWPEIAIQHAQKAKKAESDIENVYRQALAELFTPPEDFAGMVEILKRREVYRHLSNAGDRVDEAADIISDIIMKMS